MTIQEIFKKAYIKYSLSPLDAGILLSLAIKRPREYILAHPEKKLSAIQMKKFDSFCTRRSNGEPVAYVTGKKEFFGLEFLVNKNVLIPRPETELLVEHVLGKITDNKYKIPDTIFDVGTGSGNIIVSIAKNIPQIFQNEINFYAIDISKESLQVAKANAKRYKLNKKIKFIQSDMLEYFLKRKTKLENILIIANLPYVSENIYKKNYKNLKYEPKKALLSKNKGLGYYLKFFKQLKKIPSKCYILHVTCFVEFSPEQKPEIGRIIQKYWPKAKTAFFRDLAGKWRMAKIEIA
ncbi:MAG: peptide chain release factor N(5)-glutamine methyltransferase [Parcubacteria group bacterium]|jgi:release factor glutamine methyltransferase